MNLTTEIVDVLVKKQELTFLQFLNRESLERFLVMQFEVFNTPYATRCHVDFNKTFAALEEMFKKLYESTK